MKENISKKQSTATGGEYFWLTSISLANHCIACFQYIRLVLHSFYSSILQVAPFSRFEESTRF